ncbi:MAG: cyclic nucleotide-binding domain-containing protein [Tissierellales bacterium]|jgi:hypothetical protein|nr:cyclic nucleotide-binding domain-containing protein [Tissierellales bacterium]
MRTSVVIPTYWGRKKGEPWQEGDAVYDHPTYIDGEDTLGRTLESMKGLNDKNFKLIIPICPTTREIEEVAEKRVREIVEKAELDIETYLFTPKNARAIEKLLREKGLQESALDLLELKGYSNVRNMCLYSAHILSSDVTILIDDDEVFEKADFIGRATEFIGKRLYGKSIFGVAGYYLNKKDEYYDDVDMKAWMTYWDRFGSKAKAFDKIISCDPRLKQTPFAFGGLMVIHKNMYRIVPFDPSITRGEDIDYLMNAKMFGYDFFLDNTLNIKHLPPPKNHPIWKRFREDIYRFLYEKSKIDNQYETANMRKVTAEDFEPYPGDFLKEDLEDKIFKTNILLALDYLAQGEVEACREAINNIYLSKYEAIPKMDTFTEYRKIQKAWEKLIEATVTYRREIRGIIETNNLTNDVKRIDPAHFKDLSAVEIKDIMKSMPEFKEFSDFELSELAQITYIKAYKNDEVIFKKGDKDSRLYIILRGCVRIVKRNDMGEEIPLSKICSRGILGETAIVNEDHHVDAVADEFVELLTVDQKDIEKLIQKDPKVGNKILFMFLDKLFFKLSNTNELVKQFVMKDTEQIKTNE